MLYHNNTHTHTQAHVRAQTLGPLIEWKPIALDYALHSTISIEAIIQIHNPNTNIINRHLQRLIDRLHLKAYYIVVDFSVSLNIALVSKWQKWLEPISNDLLHIKPSE